MARFETTHHMDHPETYHIIDNANKTIIFGALYCLMEAGDSYESKFDRLHITRKPLTTEFLIREIKNKEISYRAKPFLKEAMIWCIHAEYR